MKDLFSIGEVSKLFRIQSSALRYYCELGLLLPHIDASTGYRYFSTSQFERLNTIKYLQALGLSLQEIRHFLDHRNVTYLIEQLEVQKQITQEKIIELQQIEQKIDTRLMQMKDALEKQHVGVISERFFEQRKLVVLRQPIPKGADLELSIRLLENSSELQSAVFLGKIGMSIAQKNILLKTFDEYASIFLFVENDVVKQSIEEVLPAGHYVTLRFHGTHSDASIYYEQLISYMVRNQYKIIGDSVEITFVDYGLSNNTNEFITEIQIPFEQS